MTCGPADISIRIGNPFFMEPPLILHMEGLGGVESSTPAPLPVTPNESSVPPHVIAEIARLITFINHPSWSDFQKIFELSSAARVLLNKIGAGSPDYIIITAEA